jgi:hypothetical protein
MQQFLIASLQQRAARFRVSQSFRADRDLTPSIVSSYCHFAADSQRRT